MRKHVGVGEGEEELDMFKGVHAPGPIEFTLCGMAPDAFETGDSSAPIVIAEPREKVTCETCRAYIDFVFRHYKTYRYMT